MAETVYMGHDNQVRLICTENSSAIDTSALTKAAIQLNVLIDSTDAAAGLIRWNQVGYLSGEIRLCFGTSTRIVPGVYDAPLILFDATNTNGIVWGTVGIEVCPEPAGSTTT